jgi:hypothetical protein
VHHKEKGRSPHCACERPALPRSAAASQNDGDQDSDQHIEIELARRILATVLCRGCGKKGRRDQENQRNRQAKDQDRLKNPGRSITNPRT